MRTMTGIDTCDAEPLSQLQGIGIDQVDKWVSARILPGDPNGISANHQLREIRIETALEKRASQAGRRKRNIVAHPRDAAVKEVESDGVTGERRIETSQIRVSVRMRQHRLPYLRQTAETHMQLDPGLLDGRAVKFDAMNDQVGMLGTEAPEEVEDRLDVEALTIKPQTPQAAREVGGNTLDIAQAGSTFAHSASADLARELELDIVVDRNLAQKLPQTGIVDPIARKEQIPIREQDLEVTMHDGSLGRLNEPLSASSDSSHHSG